MHFLVTDGQYVIRLLLLQRRLSIASTFSRQKSTCRQCIITFWQQCCCCCVVGLGCSLTAFLLSLAVGLHGECVTELAVSWRSNRSWSSWHTTLTHHARYKSCSS